MRIKIDKLPISREFKIEQFQRELAHMEELLAHFHDELLKDHDDVNIIYGRIWLNYAHDSVKEASDALKGLQRQVSNTGIGLTELAELAKQS